MRNGSGFTLVELLVTVAVAAILLMVAVPGFQSLIRGNQATTEANALHTALLFARSEALKRRGSVTLCRSADGASCGGNWADGWIVFNDTDADGALDAGETLLRVGSAVATGISLSVSPAGTNFVRFQPGGAAGTAVTWTLTPSTCPSAQPGIRDITLSAIGQASVTDVKCP